MNFVGHRMLFRIKGPAGLEYLEAKPSGMSVVQMICIEKLFCEPNCSSEPDTRDMNSGMLPGSCR